MENSFNLHAKLILLWWKHRKVVWTSQLNKHDIGCLEESHSPRVFFPLDGYLNFNQESRSKGKGHLMLLRTPARPKKGGGGNGGEIKDRGTFPPYFKKVSPFGTTYLVRFPFYLPMSFPQQCRSIFRKLMKFCRTSHQRSLGFPYTELSFDFWLKLI